MKSSTGLTADSTVSLPAAAIPMGTPTTTEIRVATRIWASVVIAASQIPSTPSSAMPTVTPAASFQSPTAQASPATAARTMTHGSHTRKRWAAPTARAETSLIAPKNEEVARVNSVTPSLMAPWMFSEPANGNPVR